MKEGTAYLTHIELDIVQGTVGIRKTVYQERQDALGQVLREAVNWRGCVGGAETAQLQAMLGDELAGAVQSALSLASPT